MRNEFVEGHKSPAGPLPAGHWRVELLGGFAARNGDVPIGRFPGRAERLLFITLALEPGRAWRREALIDRLWPQAVAPETGRARLRTALANLRRLLELPGMRAGTVVGGADDAVWLEAAAVSCDVADFEALVRQRDFAAARAAYRGELLPLLTEDWVDAERRRLQAWYERAGGLPEEEADDDVPPPAPAAPRMAIDVDQRRLPRHRDRFVGRAAELQALARATQASRLVTLTGPGGCGKTRLALEAAHRRPAGETVVWVSLAECRDGGLVFDHLRAARGLHAGALSTLDQVVADLEGQRLLVLLDNFEQLVTPAGLAAVATLLARLPQVRWWITSRQPLGLPEEAVLALEPLPLPAAEAAPAAALRTASVQLFVERARQARADFALHGRNGAAVVALCRLLDGLPLALELAASRVRELPPEAMCRALNDGEAPLRRKGRRTPQGRHASLERLIEWSWNLLPADQQHTLAVFTVFRGGASAEQVAAVGGGTPEAVQDRLAGLVRASLLVSTATPTGAARYALLHSIGEGLRPLAQAGPALRLAHRRCFSALAKQAAAAQQPLEEADVDNVMHALAGAVAEAAPAEAVAFALDLVPHWQAAGLTPEALAALRLLADVAAAAPAAEAVPLWSALGLLFGGHGLTEEALALVERALAAAGTEPALRAQALLARVRVRGRALQQAPDLAQDAEAARTCAAAAHRPDLLALASREAAEILRRSGGEAGVVEAAFVQAREALAAQGNRVGALDAEAGRLGACLDAGRYAEVAQAVPPLLEEAAALHHVALELSLLNRLGVALEGLRRWRQAVDVCQRMVRTARRHGMAYHAAQGMWNQCQPLLRLRRPHEALRLMAFSALYWQARFGPLTEDDQRYLAEVREGAEARLGRPAAAAAWREGESLSIAEGLGLASG